MIYKSKKIDSTFIEVTLPKKTNLIVGCIYRHLCMQICAFNDHYLNSLLDKLSKEANKTIVLLGDFNIDLLNFDTSNHINTLLDDLASNSLQPQILLRTRVCKNSKKILLRTRLCKNSKTLIDNIFWNIPKPLVKGAISGNKTLSISDHPPQFFMLPDFFSNSTPTKYNIICHDWKYFNNQLFLADFEKINWNQVLQLNQSNFNLTFDNYESSD